MFRLNQIQPTRCLSIPSTENMSSDSEYSTTESICSTQPIELYYDGYSNYQTDYSTDHTEYSIDRSNYSSDRSNYSMNDLSLSPDHSHSVIDLNFSIDSLSFSSDHNNSMNDLTISINNLSFSSHDTSHSTNPTVSVTNQQINKSLDPNDELNLKAEQISSHIHSLTEQFQEFSASLNQQEKHLAQLYSQHNYCSSLLSTFDDFLLDLNIEIDSTIYDGWFAHINLLQEQFDQFDTDGDELIQRLNNRMKLLFDQFIQNKNRLRSNSTLIDLYNIAHDLRIINCQISTAELELDDIVDCISVQIQEQRNLITEFVELMQSICNSIESTILLVDITEEDFFDCQDFILTIRSKLSQIQLI